MPVAAPASNQASSHQSCLLDPLRRLSTPAKEPVNWQNATAVSSNTLPQEYRKLILENKIVVELRKENGLGNRLEFNIQHYDPKVERKPETARNGAELQAVYLKQVLSQVFPQSLIRDYQVDRPLNSTSSRKQIALKVGDSAVTSSTNKAAIAQGLTDKSLVEMGLLKSANPGPEVAPKSKIREAFNIPNDAKVVSVYGSARTYSDEVSSFVIRLLRLDEVDTVIVSSNHYEAIRYQLSRRRLKDVYFADSDDYLPTTSSAKTVIINETRGMLPVVHAASDKAIVLGSPNIIEPINVGVPTIVYRQAEDNFDQSIWNKQTELIAATGGGHVASSIHEAIDFLEDPKLSKPKRKTYEVVDSDGATAIDRLMTNIAEAMRSGQVP